MESEIQFSLGQSVTINSFPEEVYYTEIKYYLTKQNEFGLPLATNPVEELLIATQMVPLKYYSVPVTSSKTTMLFC